MEGTEELGCLGVGWRVTFFEFTVIEEVILQFRRSYFAPITVGFPCLSYVVWEYRDIPKLYDNLTGSERMTTVEVGSNKVLRFSSHQFQFCTAFRGRI